jgi:hypothetical protein
VRGLRRFAHRVLIANVEGDDKVPHWSAALVQGGAEALDNPAELAVQQESLLSGDTILFPHVSATFKQRPVSALLETPSALVSVAESLKLPPEGKADSWDPVGDYHASFNTAPSTHSL